MSFRRIITACAAGCAISLAPTPAPANDVVVVCPESYRDALAGWSRLRRGEGLELAYCEVSADPSELREFIARTGDESTRFVVLVGDAPAIGRPCDPSRQIPTHYAATRVTRPFGSTDTLATDLPYGDFDGDGKPDAAVGRLPVDTPEQLRELVDRIVTYERSRDFGVWRGQVQLTGGLGGFGKLADAAIETVTRSVITSVLPPETKTTIAYASPGHRFFPRGDSFTDAVLSRYRSGSRFWVYAGHGWIDQLDRVPPDERGVPVLDAESVRKLDRDASGAPIALLLACYTGAIDAAEDSLAERMLLARGGPIAVLAGSRVTMPYGNATAAVGLIDGVYYQNRDRIGEAWLSTLREMNRDDSSDDKTGVRMLIDTLAAFCSPGDATLADRRREHMLLYNLIGDPTLRLHQPEAIDLHVSKSPEAGAPIELKMTSPIGGRLTLTLDRPLGSDPGDDPNNTTLRKIVREVEPGREIRSSLAPDDGIRGPVIVRALVAGQSTWATAAIKLVLR